MVNDKSLTSKGFYLRRGPITQRGREMKEHLNGNGHGNGNGNGNGNGHGHGHGHGIYLGRHPESHPDSHTDSHPDRRMMVDYVAGVCSSEERNVIEGHCINCHICWAQLSTLLHMIVSSANDLEDRDLEKLLPLGEQ